MTVKHETANTIEGPKYGEPREMPWHIMGENLKPEHQTNLAKALQASGLDYEVRTLPVVAHDGPEDEPVAFHTLLDASKSRAVVRPVEGVDRVVGMVGTRFTPIQNPSAFAIAEPLVGEYGATITGMADFRHGGASLMVLNLGKPTELNRPDGGTDLLDLNLLVKNAHDGSSALTFALTEMRLACTNALPAALRNAERVWKFSHTPNAEDRMNLATKSILRAVGYQEKFAVAAQAMMDQPMVDAEFAKIVAGLWPVAPDAEGKVAERKRAIQDDLLALYQQSVTLDGIRGTRWGGYNAITEYLDHYRPVKGNAQVARAEGALEGPNVRVKGNVWKMFATV